MRNDSFSLVESQVLPDVYQYLRRECGLSPKSTDAATRGLAASLYMVHVKKDKEVVGMGRLIGDGGCFCQVVDICVLPSYVSLIADGDAYRLYERYGFKPVWPASRGMFYRVK